MLFRHLVRRIVPAALLMAVFCVCSTRNMAYATTFVRGADVGWMTQLETLGFSWEDQTQTQLSVLQALKNHGVNTIRIRTFVNPTISSTSLGVGALNQADSIALAKTANSMGFQIMIDFQYSDTWADPSQQTIPAAWSSYTYSEMETALYNYTYNFMEALAADGIFPAYVQVGNEINSGLLWPTGKYTNLAQMVGLLNSGYNAVKAVSSSTKVVIHLANLSNLSDAEWFFDLIKSYGATWDVSGFSYYDGPGTLSTITTNLNTIAARYDKPVLICEIGHSNSDYMGTAEDMKTAIEALQAVPSSMGLGLIYWEPEAPDNSTTSNYGLGAVVSATSTLLQFNPAIDQYLFTGSTTGNQIINPQFSSATNGWQISTTTPAAVYTKSGGEGTMLSLYSASAYSATIYQDVTGLPSGTYTMTAYVENGGGQTTLDMFAEPTGGSETTVNLPTASSWTEVQLGNIQITEGSAYVGFTVSAKAGNWTNIESVQFVKN